MITTTIVNPPTKTPAAKANRRLDIAKIVRERAV